MNTGTAHCTAKGVAKNKGFMLKINSAGGGTKRDFLFIFIL